MVVLTYILCQLTISVTVTDELWREILNCQENHLAYLNQYSGLNLKFTQYPN